MNALTKEESELVTANMALVPYTLKKFISVAPGNHRLEYDDLMQIGNLALCRAAQKYDGRTRFSTFATTVIRNALIDAVRDANSDNVHLWQPEQSEDFNSDYLDSILSICPDPDSKLRAQELIRLLGYGKKHFTGISRKGIEAMELKAMGYSTAEIAEKYGSNSDNVRLWINRARKKLMNEGALNAN